MWPRAPSGALEKPTGSAQGMSPADHAPQWGADETPSVHDDFCLLDRETVLLAEGRLQVPEDVLKDVLDPATARTDQMVVRLG